MSRTYTALLCGCYISCDGGGGLIPGCGTWSEEGIWIENKDCQVDDYLKEHNTKHTYYCPVCHPIEYDNEVEERKANARRNKKNFDKTC